MMRNHGTIPVLVFDGQTLPLKAAITGAARNKRRKEAKSKAQDLLSKGDKDGAEAVRAMPHAVCSTTSVCASASPPPPLLLLF